MAESTRGGLACPVVGSDGGERRCLEEGKRAGGFTYIAGLEWKREREPLAYCVRGAWEGCDWGGCMSLSLWGDVHVLSMVRYSLFVMEGR